MTKLNQKRILLLFIIAAFPVFIILKIFKLHCYVGTELFGCPRYGIPDKFTELRTRQEIDILRNYTCPVHGTDLILVTTTEDKVHLHDKIYEFYSKRGYEVRFLLGKIRGSKAVGNFQRYIIGDFEDRYENLHYKTFSAFQFVARCSLQNSNIIFLDDDTFFDPFQTISPASITCGYARNNVETTWKKPFGKFRLSNDVWPDNYRYPTYCAGACTVMSSSTAQKIYSVARKIELSDFNMEDVLFTGVYRTLADIEKPAVNRRLCHHYAGDYDAILEKFNSHYL